VGGAYRKVRLYLPIGTAGRFSYFDDIEFERTDLTETSTVPPDSA
jgi:hypothetical protein